MQLSRQHLIQLCLKWLLILFFTGCAISREERLILIKYRQNKELEIMFLEEIQKAQDNEDHDAFIYFLNEYMQVERINVPDDLKNHPEYYQGGKNIKY